MTPAQRLRAAADLIERTGYDAAVGPWEADSPAAGVWSVYDARGFAAAEGCDRGDATWIALLGPDTAPTLAAWLRREAQFADVLGEETPVTDDPVWQALAFADLILRGQA